MACADCGHAAKFHSYQQRRLLTVHGEVKVQRAYYYCGRCQQSFLPYDEALGLVDEISPGLLPLVCLAGTLLSAQAQEELRKRIGNFENNRQRTAYPTYRQKGWDIGSGPTEAGCKIIGERLKGSGMRWVEDGRGHGGGPACPVCQRPQGLGRLLGQTPPPRRVKIHPSKRCTL